MTIPKGGGKTQVLIIGAGVTGIGLARDLALRGVSCLLVEKKDFNAGASGGNHGLLHSGARYVLSDPASARECREENELLQRLAPQCIEPCGGLFVAVEGDDENFIARFPLLCEKAGIPTRSLDPKEARELEPVLSEKVIAAYAVEDGSIDPFRLSLDNLAQAEEKGCRFLPYSRVLAFERAGSRIRKVFLEETRRGETFAVEAEVVVNAAGAWAGQVAALAGLSVPVLFSKGSLVITPYRLAQRVINRLRPPSDADILVPGGTVSILGTTSIRVDDLEAARPEVEEVEAMIEDAKAMVPLLERVRYIRAYCGVRPLVGGQGDGDDRSISRGFALLDHSREGLENFITITGGKLTTYRLMAEKTADRVCRLLGIDRPCLTREIPLPPSSMGGWTEPAGVPRHQPDRLFQDSLVCECEAVPEEALDSLLASLSSAGIPVDLPAVGLRSRIGKGRCQGGFCGPRAAALLFNRRPTTPREARQGLREFLRGRWKGVRPVLWGEQLAQAELSEAVHLGFLGLEGEEG
jgi:glycerol-3-phosphate dehydrogenase